MQKSTIQTLNSINKKFYDDIAQDFSQSREHFWPGWQKLSPYITSLAQTKNKLTILDLGCGNGRFADFLRSQFPEMNWEYIGIDSNNSLLSIARDTYQNTHIQFLNKDIVESLNQEKDFLDDITYDVIVGFGVLHHIPSKKLREAFLTEINKHLHTNGIACVTIWRFMDIDRLEKKKVSPETVAIKENELEENDYFISWKRGTTAYRYCHYTDEVEQSELITAARFSLKKSFLADGREGEGNNYLILEKK